ncbi:laccase-2-like [Gigantopelta aegis]|uniref:laccase-2-like n=1 Tax=Gigantopelta aegis TaxID=1735272 RepID=UPI001B88B94D|nr:laccase-2-like [Gigantopelta aegis]
MFVTFVTLSLTACYVNDRRHRLVINRDTYRSGFNAKPLSGKPLLTTENGDSGVKDYTSHPCLRECDSTAPPRVCEYNFTVENYATRTKACYDCPFTPSDCFRPHCIPGDGNPRSVIVANRMLSGPSIQVCEGDEVVVNVHNKMIGGEGTTIHWHGLHQRGTPEMDGAVLVTQCPIHAHSTFQYRFSARSPGTHFWHAHAGVQRGDGLFGSFVVRQSAAREPHRKLYDLDESEHTITLMDWMRKTSVEVFTDKHHSGGPAFPQSLLVNGRSQFHKITLNNTNETTHIPYSVFDVKQGHRYRFRVISNAAQNCPMQVSVDNHTLLVIALDGSPIQPEPFDVINIFGGERIDFVLSANQSVGNYWLRVTGDGSCGFYFLRAMTLAILRYTGAPEVVPTAATDFKIATQSDRFLSPYNTNGPATSRHVVEMTSLHPDDVTLKATPDKKFYLRVDFNRINNYNYHSPELYPLENVTSAMELLTNQINYISSILPPSPLLTQHGDVPEEMFCNERTVKKNCTLEFCECVHVQDVRLNDVIELVIVDEGQSHWSNHPFHLHGHQFRVVALEKVSKQAYAYEVKRLDAEGHIKRKLSGAPLKDTVNVPDGGYTVVRFHATNPGFWLFHCHSEFHAQIGLSMIFKVGDIHQMVTPSKGFPKCGNWKPEMTTGSADDESTSSSSQRTVYSLNAVSVVVTLLVGAVMNVVY